MFSIRLMKHVCSRCIKWYQLWTNTNDGNHYSYMYLHVVRMPLYSTHPYSTVVYEKILKTSVWKKGERETAIICLCVCLRQMSGGLQCILYNVFEIGGCTTHVRRFVLFKWRKEEKKTTTESRMFFCFFYYSPQVQHYVLSF